MTRIAPEKPLQHVSSLEYPLGTAEPRIELTSQAIPSAAKSIWRSMLGWSGLIAASFAAGWYFGGARESRQHQIALTEGAAASQESSTAIPVTVAPISERTVSRTVSAVGSLHAFEDVAVSSKVEGRVQRILVDVSTRVKPGDVLLELDATDARLAVEQSERSLQAELAKWGFKGVPDEKIDLSQLPSVRSAKAKFDLSTARFERMQRLKTTGSVSDDDFDQARTDLGVLENDWHKEQLLAQSSAAVARLRAADLAIAQQRLADCQMRAPVPSLTDPKVEPEYIVSDRLVSEGSLLRPGTEVFRLVFGRTLKLRLSVPEIHASSVQPGQRVDVYPRSMDQPLSGTVAKVSPTVDRATRTFMVEVYVSNALGSLKPGGFAKASIRVAESDRAVTVPTSSVYSLAGVQKVFILDDGVVKERQVVLGEQTKDWVEITQPSLPVGALVATSGQRLLSDGISVKVRVAEDVREEATTPKPTSEDPS
jgi:RND family efflux transporter MFP subunit